MKVKLNSLTLVVFVLLLSCVSAVGQTLVRGNVRADSDGQPLIGVTVLLKGTATGTATDFDGNFEIQVPDANSVLVFSYTGFAAQELTVGNRTFLNVSLSDESALLDEVVVVAYGTIRKEALTGSVGTIKSDDIALRPLNNVTTVIEGAIPGVVTQTANGQPGSGLAIRVRGFGSINATSEPLFVVDGVPYVGGSSNINPDDVESITILKDASSTALYGSRAANGVVMITTKRGKKGRNNVSLKVSQGVASRGLPEYERVDAFEYYPLMWEAQRNQLVFPGSGAAISRDSANRVASGLTNRPGIHSLLAYNPFNVPNNQIVGVDGRINPNAQLIYGDDLDWTKDLLRTGNRSDYGVNFSGGADNYNYFVSAGYLREDGYTLNTDFERYTARMNVTVQPKDWLRTNLNIGGNHTVSNTARDGGSTSFVNPFFFSRNIGPIYPVFAHNMTTGEFLIDPATGRRFWDIGNLGDSGLGIPNRPGGGFAGRHALAETTLNEQLFTRTVVSARSATDFFFLKNFRFTNNIGVDFQYQGDDSFENTLVGDGAPAGRSRREFSSNTGFTASQLLGYTNEFGKHGIDILLGHESYNQRLTNVNGFKQGQSLSGNTELNNFTTINSLTSALDRYRIESYFSRVNYNFQDKYLLSASIRQDGNSRFARESRWGTFWSVGAGWNVNREEFFKADWVDQLKFRTSYGVTGVADGIGFYAYQGLYVFANNANEPGIRQNPAATLNPDLTWENNETFDIGFDFSLFKGRVSGSFEYYDRISRDLLFAVPQPVSSGAFTVNQNTATMFNRGIEANLNVDIIRTKDFTWNTNFNISTVKNQITRMPESVPEFITGTKKYEVGRSIFDYWLRTYYGVDPSDGSALYVADNTQAAAAIMRYITNSSGGIDTVTTSINNAKFEYNGSVIPDFYGSFTQSFTYKNFTLSGLFTFQVGGLTYDGLYQSLMLSGNYGRALHRDALNRWQNEGDITNVPRMDAGRSVDFDATSSRWLTDASFINIRNINVSYRLPRSFTSRIKINNGQVFVGAENVAFFSRRVGMNNQQAFSGVTSNAYPPARVISGGFNVTF
ncbi:MAG TPA: SusC/RagA family TonB-linked outer membrane protein [Saprospiraceae bacterium]|nr:SusC/RagA family TonB-linked outer membrane protein [Saprospiraceae bacterium]HMP26167.1 SusC/RagA family TonB-linked outer membrane protein [Saprospiraceae bacterium]